MTLLPIFAIAAVICLLLGLAANRLGFGLRDGRPRFVVLAAFTLIAAAALANSAR